MLGYVANTDPDWFDFLAKQLNLEEVNFWSPSAHYGFGGKIGSPWFFRLKAPRNAIGGFGIVARFEKLPEWLAWECFEKGNGMATQVEFETRLRELRKTNKIDPHSASPQIGCFILTNFVFFPQDRWVRQPSDWAKQNLRYTGYDLTQGEGARLWRECQHVARTLSLGITAPAVVQEEIARYGDPVWIQPRLGQGIFRLAVTAAYSRACGVTGEHSLPALEAAHIRPYGQGGEHAVKNGLLLRSDLHRLFDRGYITVTPERRVEVSGRLKADYNNGATYYPFHGKEVVVPRGSDDAPAAELLQWHNENVFRAR